MHFFKLLFLTSLVIPSIGFSQSLRYSVHSIGSKHDLVGGHLVVFYQDKIIESIPFGKANLAKNINVNTQTKFRVASISKTITSIAVMQLVQNKKINLDTDINTILNFPLRNPYFPETPITVRMLLSNTSTILDGVNFMQFANSTYRNSQVPKLSELFLPNGSYYTLSQFANKVPGEFYTYANINFAVLATIVERVTGIRFDQYCIQNIFKPLDIKASFNLNDLGVDEVAAIYTKNSNGEWKSQIDDYNGVSYLYANLSSYVIGENGLRFSPQSGLRISAPDLAIIFMVLMNGGTYRNIQLLQSHICAQMLSNHWTYNGTNGDTYGGIFRSWGLGIQRLTNTPRMDFIFSDYRMMYGHIGEALGFVGNVFFDPQTRMGFVFYTNGSGKGYPFDTKSAFRAVERDVFDALESSYFK
jgi:CubicO group peptidase (beta-lactamase class C family)